MMTSANHIKIVNKLYEYRLSKDWEKLEELIHDDYCGFTEKEVAYSIEAQSLEEAITNYATDNPFIHFLEIFGFQGDIISEGIEVLVPANIDKSAIMQYWKWASKVYSSFEIIEIIADDDRVWFTRKGVINDPKQQSIKLSTFNLVAFKDNKIINYISMGRYMMSLIQYGKMVATRNEKFEIQQYVKGLKKMGILPP